MALYERVDSLEISGGGGTGSGEINYISNPNAESDATGWATYNDGAVAIPVDGTGGTATHLTFTRQNTTIIRDLYSFRLAKAVLDSQGEGLSTDFTIDKADQNKLLKISFDYNTDGTYVDEDLKVYIYDVTNATLITPADNGIIGKDKDDNSSGARTMSWASTDSLSYRLIFHLATTNASGYDLYLDNVIVGPGSVAVGPAIYAPVQKTGSGSQTTDAEMTEFTYSDLVIGATYKIEYTFSGYVNDGGADDQVTVVPYDDTTNISLGNLSFNGGGTDTSRNYGSYNLIHTMASAKLSFHTQSANSTSKIEKGESVVVVTRLPEESVNLMSDNVVVANARARYSLSTGTVVNETTSVPIPFDVEKHNEGGFVNTGGKITVPAEGYYNIIGQVAWTNTSAGNPSIYIVVDSVVEAVARVDETTAASTDRISATVKLLKGQEVWMAHTASTASQTVTGSTQNSSYLELNRLPDYSAGQPVGFGLATATNAGLVPAFESGIYTPVKIGGTASLTGVSYPFAWQRINNIVTITGIINFNGSQLVIDLPSVAGGYDYNFTIGNDYAAGINHTSIAGQSGRCIGTITGGGGLEIENSNVADNHWIVAQIVLVNL